MHKILKLTGILVGILALLIVLAIIFLVTFVSPNRLKPVLTAQVMKYTGRQLVMDGNMSWTFFPYLGVRVGHSSLSNPAGFNEKTFAEISNITVAVKLMPLFSRQIESSGIQLDGMKLHLIKNKNGQVNWNFNLAVPVKNSGGTEPTTSEKMTMGLIVSGLDVTNTAIDYSDEQMNKYYNIKNFELHAKEINLSRAFPVNASFDFSANNPALSGQAALKGNALLNMASAIYSFRDLNFSATINQDSKKMKMSVSGDVTADLNQQTLQWTGFKAKVDNVEMKGQVNVTAFNTSPVTTAQLHIDTLQTAKLTVTDVAVKAHFQKGILDLAPVTAKLYQGSLTGQTLVNLNSSVPQITLHAKLANVQAEPLMEDLGGKDQKIKIAGLANFEMQVTTAGTDPKTLLQNLNGVSQFTFNNGALIGIDLGYLVDSAYALVKRQPMTATNSNQTNFGTLTGTAVIRSGVINNNDLSADTPRFAIRGAGTIDLVNQKMDYALQTNIKQRQDKKDNAMNLYGITLPVLITGNLKSPSIRLDSAAVAKALAEQQLKKVTNQTKDKLQEQIKKQLPGKAGDLLNKWLGN